MSRIIPDNMPTILCLCGSTRFASTFQEWNWKLTLAGKIVLSIGVDTKSDEEVFKDFSQDVLEGIKRSLDVLHLRKIELADVVLILNDYEVHDRDDHKPYIGDSTKRELVYARSLKKEILWLNKDERMAVGEHVYKDGGQAAPDIYQTLSRKMLSNPYQEK